MIVVDTNVLVYAVRPGQHTDAALQAKRRDPDWVAPSFWRIEMLNVLAVSRRVDGMELATAIEAFAVAESLVEDSQVRPTSEQSLHLTNRGSISAYDAEFVFTAKRLGTKLITADRRLLKAFPDLTQSLADFGASSA